MNLNTIELIAESIEVFVEINSFAESPSSKLSDSFNWFITDLVGLGDVLTFWVLAQRVRLDGLRASHIHIHNVHVYIHLHMLADII